MVTQHRNCIQCQRIAHFKIKMVNFVMYFSPQFKKKKKVLSSIACSLAFTPALFLMNLLFRDRKWILQEMTFGLCLLNLACFLEEAPDLSLTSLQL